MSEADIEAEPAGPAPSLFWVAAYLVRREFGGMEDGGWFFDERTLVTDPAVYQRLNGHRQLVVDGIAEGAIG